MTKVRREEGHVDMFRGSRAKMKKRTPLAPLRLSSGVTSASTSRSTLPDPEQKKVGKWFNSRDNSRSPSISGDLSTTVLNLTVDRFEPDTSELYSNDINSSRIRSLTKSPLRRSKLYRENKFENPSNNVCHNREPDSRKATCRKATSKVVNRSGSGRHSIFDVGFDAAVLEVISNIDHISRVPLFQRLQCPGSYDDKIKTTEPTQFKMEEDQKEQELSKQIMHYVREREAALDEVKKAKAELLETQSKLYDALNLIEELEKKVPDTKKNKNTKKSPAPKKKQLTEAASKPAPKANAGNGVKTSAGQSDSVYHPPLDDLDPSANSKQYYWKLAESFPTLPMMQILEAEKKFIDADADNSGYIDKDELDTVLSNSVGLFTPKQVEEIFNEVDTNHNESVDFYEVLVILNKLYSKRRTNLPQSVQQNYSKTCSIQ